MTLCQNSGNRRSKPSVVHHQLQRGYVENEDCNRLFQCSMGKHEKIGQASIISGWTDEELRVVTKLRFGVEALGFAISDSSCIETDNFEAKLKKRKNGLNYKDENYKTETTRTNYEDCAYKQHDNKAQPTTYHVEDWVYLTKTTVRNNPVRKSLTKFTGPYQILEVLGKVKILTPLRMTCEDSPYFKVNYASPKVITRLAPGMSVYFDVKFTPEEERDYKHQITFLTDKTSFTVPVYGEKLVTSLHGMAENANIMLSKETVHIEDTYMGLKRQTTMTLHNNSDHIVHFKWGKYQSREEEGLQMDNSSQNGQRSPKTFHVLNTIEILNDDYDSSDLNSEQMELVNELMSDILDDDDADHDFVPVSDSSSNKEIISKSGTKSRVVISESDDSQETNDESKQKLSRKRRKQPAPQEWKCNIRKAKRQSGRSYISLRGKDVPPRLKDVFEVVKTLETEKTVHLEMNNVISKECHTTLYDRIYQDEVKALDCEEFLFSSRHFSLIPLTGEVWPNAFVDVTIVFNPDEAKDFQTKTYCDVTGLEDRLPLIITGRGLGPLIELNLASLDMSLIYLCSVHSYEV
ncbi:unnamed protein product [Timema podura]|uniref:Uncharacterized protein n=1 Tax=Timema podura TaxID=61482 RepID=A0ABN7NDC9_TIMPD|nr:unnamed protein product [Timema podura]